MRKTITYYNPLNEGVYLITLLGVFSFTEKMCANEF